jgi:hypothetical protein
MHFVLEEPFPETLGKQLFSRAHENLFMSISAKKRGFDQFDEISFLRQFRNCDYLSHICKSFLIMAMRRVR